MFRVLYEVVASLAIVQGAGLPLVLVGSGWLWWRQAAQLEALTRAGAAAERRGGKDATDARAALARLPTRAPLRCPACGAATSLRVDATLCTHCGTRGELPADYTALAQLRPQLRALTSRANRHWRVAHLLTRAPVRWLLTAMIFVEPLVLLPVLLIGSNLYPDTWLDRTLTELGEPVAVVLMGFVLLGFVVWMILFIMLAGTSRGLASKLPGMPVFAELALGTRQGECVACGGAIEYEARGIACLCPYCHVENFRVRFVARRRLEAEARERQTRSVLFAATTILEDLTGTVCVLMVALVAIPGLAAAVYAWMGD